MKDKIIANDKHHLGRIIKEEIAENGNQCDLNHIDVSQITDMSYVFHCTKFNGDISQWDVSNAEDMTQLFYNSKFNGDISKWNTSKVTEMDKMFAYSKFNGDISQWDVSSVESMNSMFYKADFNGDTSQWKPVKAYLIDFMFTDCPANKPYWAEHEDVNIRKKAIDAYCLDQELKINNVQTKRMKI